MGGGGEGCEGGEGRVRVVRALVGGSVEWRDMGARGLAFMVVCVWKAAYVNDAGNGWRPLGFGFRLSALVGRLGF